MERVRNGIQTIQEIAEEAAQNIQTVAEEATQWLESISEKREAEVNELKNCQQQCVSIFNLKYFLSNGS